jgi:hypothetical protein
MFETASKKLGLEKAVMAGGAASAEEEVDEVIQNNKGPLEHLFLSESVYSNLPAQL